MALQIHRFGEEGSPPVYHRFLITGQSGTGKTAAACLAEADLDVDLDALFAGRVTPKGDGQIFLLALERNGLATARMVNPALGYVLADPLDEDGLPHPERALELARETFRAACSGELRKLGFTRLVVDGITELQRLLKDDIVDGLMGDHEDDADWRENWFSQDDWNYLKEKARRAFAWIRAIPMDLVCTGLEDSFVNKKTGVETIGLKLEGRDNGATMQFFEAVCRMDRVVVPLEHGKTRIEHRAMFTGPGRYLVKPCGPVTGWQRPCASAWMSVLEKKVPPERTRIEDRMAVVDPDAATDRVTSPTTAAAEGSSKPPGRSARRRAS